MLQQAVDHAQQRLAARFQTLEQPARFLQVAAQVTGIGAATAADQLLVAAMDDDLGPGVAGQCAAPHAALPPDHAVGHDVGVGGHVAELFARAGIEGAQQLHGFFDGRHRLLQLLGDTGDAGARQAFQRALGDAAGQAEAGRAGGQGVQLQGQAFTQ
ncbi:hypothetical protein D3C81_929340 [compost metagenome]